MYLTEKVVTPKLKDYKEISEFMQRVFPKEEFMSMWMLNLLSKLKKFNFSAFYDEDLFVGILFTIDLKDTLFVFYIAVNDKIHSKGYGSKLLQLLFDKYPKKSVSLFIETMDNKTADNYEQRIKRLAFYERNGFIHTGIKAGFKTPFYDILSTDKEFDIKKSKRLLMGMPMKIFIPDELK